MQLPFEHESLLLDQDEDQLTETEKLEAIKGDFVVLCPGTSKPVYACVCSCVFVYVYTHVLACLSMHVCVCVLVCLCMCAHVLACLNISVGGCVGVPAMSSYC